MSELVDMFRTDDDVLGVVRLSRWPEGMVLWVGGQIAWKSWETPKTDVSEVTLRLRVKVDVEVQPCRWHGPTWSGPAVARRGS